ncbi:MAG: branched-chain amino acid ABC transporter permease [Betaproteobacteria bacterium]|nr:branched-chain amino acid ABC transporter permease [Betaproteobacteria bacterium]
MKLASDRALWIFAAAALALPIIADGNKFLAFVLGMTYISLLWATGMNLMYGFVGLMPLMFAGVAGIAGYAVVHLTRELGWSFWLAMPVATVMAALAGVALGLPSLRLKGFYFTLCSLVIQTVLTLAFIFFPTYTNGDTGINQISPPDWFGGQLKGLGLELMIALFTVVGILICAWIVRSPLGQRFVAIREDDILAEAIGIRVVRCKIIAFFIVSLYAGVGGCFYSVYIGFISPRAFDVLVSMNIWLFVAFGGRGTIAGPIIGTAILAPIPFLLQDLQAFKDILSGVLIIVVTLLMPGGIYGAWLARRRRTQKAMTDSARVQESRV